MAFGPGAGSPLTAPVGRIALRTSVNICFENYLPVRSRLAYHLHIDKFALFLYYYYYFCFFFLSTVDRRVDSTTYRRVVPETNLTGRNVNIVEN